MTGFGPLFQLQVAGSLCPCLEKSEHRYARLAVAEINQQCRQVEWTIPGNKNAGGVGGTASSFLGGLFRSGNSGPASEGSCKARLILRDSGGDGKPEIFVDPCAVRPSAAALSDPPVAADEEGAANHKSSGTTPGYKLNVRLRRVDKVSLEDNQIVLYARKANQSTQPAKELLRFTPLQHSNEPTSTSNNGNTALPMTSDARNMLVHHFMVIVEWERQRTKNNYDDDDDADDDENQPNFLQARAQKAAHFAKREIEMQRTRKDREKRKAKLVAEAGGLRYTALAMANGGSGSNGNNSIT
jgi:hypothetical protein